jgi:HlyD family secretion protein
MDACLVVGGRLQLSNNRFVGNELGQIGFKRLLCPFKARRFSIGLLLVVFGCDQNNPESKPFATATVTIAPLVDSVLATARVHTVTSVDVSSQLSGRMNEVFVDYNDQVSEGDPLARLDPLRFQSRVEELTAALAMAEAELLSVKATLEGTQARYAEDERDYKRKTDLAAKGSVSDSDVSRALAVKLQSESALKTLAASKAIKTATIAAARASLNQAQIDLDRTVIRAPIAGVVIKRSIPGQTVAVSLSAPELFTIANDLSAIELHARVDESDVGKVRTGQTVTFTVDAYPERKFAGGVSQIRKAPEISQNVVVYTVLIEAPNPDELMLPGMTALVEIITARKVDVLQIANAALRFEMPEASVPQDIDYTGLDPTNSGAWVVTSEGKYERVSLEIGYSDGEFSEIRSGKLAMGDQVIVGYRR